MIIPSTYFEAADGTVNVEPEVLRADVEEKINDCFDQKFKLNSVFSIQEAFERDLELIK